MVLGKNVELVYLFLCLPHEIFYTQIEESNLKCIGLRLAICVKSMVRLTNAIERYNISAYHDM